MGRADAGDLGRAADRYGAIGEPGDRAGHSGGQGAGPTRPQAPNLARAGGVSKALRVLKAEGLVSAAQDKRGHMVLGAGGSP